MTNGGYLGKDAILAAPDLEYRDVEVPEWGGVVRVREMTAADRESLGRAAEDRDKQIAAGETPIAYEALLVGKAIVDSAGNRIFTDAEIVELGKKSSRALQRIYEVAMEISAIKREHVEELKKNSETSPSADSPIS